MKAKLSSLLQELQGKLEKNDDGSITVFRTFNGKQEIYLQKKQTNERTPAQKAYYAKFKTARLQADEDYADASKRAHWQAQYDKNEGKANGKNYSTLRGYIFACIMNTLNP